MWHEARRQERKIRGMLVDYRKRAERRRDFYEKIKADPTQFLQVHGRQCKIHLDPNIAAAADSAVMMPWQGQQDNLIDRFDVRAHLDYIPPIKKEEETELTQEERQLNYERYRIIAQNSFLGITEEKFLKQLHLEEQFGYTESKTKKEPKTGGAAIGFNYEDGTGVSHYPQEQEEESDDNSDSDLDVDLAINVSKMDPAQAHEMNKHGRSFGMSSNDFYSFLTNDMEEAESYKLAKEEEQEKALFSGRRSRRERRYHREKRLANRKISPPSYAAQASPTIPQLRASKSPSRSPTPDNTGKITYITSFGDDEEPTNSKPTYADKVKMNKSKSSKNDNNSDKRTYRRRSRSYSRDRLNLSRKRGSARRSRSNSRRRSSSRKRSNSRNRSASRYNNRRSTSLNQTGSRRNSRSRSKRSRSRSRSGTSGSKIKRTKSRSRSTSRSRSRKSRSRSKSRFARSLRRKRSSSSSSSSSRSSDDRKPLSSSTELKKSPVSPEKKDKSPSPSPLTKEIEPPTKVIPRYYGRKRSDDSSSELSDDDNPQDIDMTPALNPESSDSKSGIGNSTGTAIKKFPSTSTMTIIERLKRKRQALLNRQFKADKIAEQLKTEREKQEQQTREDELREMAIRLRRRQREIRHAYDSRSSSSSDSEGSRQSSKDSEPKNRSSREQSKDREDNRNRGRRERNSSGDRRGRSRERDRRDRDRRDRESDRNIRDLDRNKEIDKNRDRERERDRDRNRDSRRDDDRRERRSSVSPSRYVYVAKRREDNGDKKDGGTSGRGLVDY